MSSIDFNSGYWQIAMDEHSAQYTAFATPLGLFEWTVMPFGLKNSPRTFARAVSEILRGLPFVRVFYDDIAVMSPDFESHLIHLDLVFARLRRADLTAHFKKCFFVRPQLPYLGRVVDQEGVDLQPEQLKCVEEFPSPNEEHKIKTKKKKLRKFLGLCQWFSCFVPQYATLAAPLTELLKDKSPWIWEDQEETAFAEVKKAIMMAKKLSHLRYDLPLRLQCDSSEVGFGCVLFQRDPENPELRHVVEYASRKLQPAESRWTALEREAGALFWAVKKYEKYLEGKKFFLTTDNRALSWMKDTKDSNSKVYRWFLLLSSMDFELEFCAGERNEGPDGLSRHPLQDGEPGDLGEHQDVGPPPLAWPPRHTSLPGSVHTSAHG